MGRLILFVRYFTGGSKIYIYILSKLVIKIFLATSVDVIIIS